ncbi:secreted chorismate mutase-like [Lycorma delicatula]|uniref:secreted chorismate mutase-like n=1 Tax=Lycorma delicatula TaxID=130591 RepID=UPI003F513548
MNIFNIKMNLALLFIISLISLASSGNVAKQFYQEDESHTDYKYPVLKNFVELIKTRISFGKDVAVYKWVNGEPILDKNREKFVLVNVEKTARKMNVPFEQSDRLFFIDLMEATKLIEYALVSDWYAREVEGNVPAGSVSLDKTRQKISEMQVDLINYLSQLKGLQKSKECQRMLARAIFETNTSNNSLLLRALQRALGNFCKENVDHRLA